MTDQDQRQPGSDLAAELHTGPEQAASNQGETERHMPQAVRDVLPELQGEIDEDSVLDAEEVDTEDDAGSDEWADAAALSAEDVSEEDADGEFEYVDVDDLLAVMGDLREMLEAQSKEIRGLRREMRDLRDAVSAGRSGGAPRRDFGGRDGGFRPREDRGNRDFGGRDGGFRPREDRGNRDFGGRDGGFRPREDRGNRDFGGRDGGFRPRKDRGNRDFGGRDGGFQNRDRFGAGSSAGNVEGGFRPRARADRGWGNRSGGSDES